MMREMGADWSLFNGWAAFDTDNIMKRN